MTSSESLDGVEVIPFEEVGRWESWLADHHERPGGVWIKVAKKSSGKTSITCPQALDVALCYGWIDSQRRSYDETYFLQKYSRRRSKSLWSRVNVDKVEALVAARRMRPPGLAEVQAAKDDGRWDAAYESQRNATVPSDLAEALAGNEQAKGFFDSLEKTGRYLVILRLMQAKTPGTRAVRLQRTMATLEAGRKVT